LTRDVVRGFGLFHQGQGGQHVADVVGVLGVAKSEILDRGVLSLAEGLDELVGDRPERVGSGWIVVTHPHLTWLTSDSMPS
jgi:hypothetical protein